MTDRISKPFSRISGFHSVKINQIFLKVTVKEEFFPSSSFDKNSYESDVERKKRGISWRGNSNSPT
jgi:hypothetical protein